MCVCVSLCECVRPQEALYAEHAEKPYFDTLIRYITSDEVLALALEKAAAVKCVCVCARSCASCSCRFCVSVCASVYPKVCSILPFPVRSPSRFRSLQLLLGPTNPEVAAREAKGTLRARFGSTVIANGVHGSASVTAANKEVCVVLQPFPLYVIGFNCGKLTSIL